VQSHAKEVTNHMYANRPLRAGSVIHIFHPTRMHVQGWSNVVMSVCVCVYVCVCVGKERKYWNASSRVARAFKDIILKKSIQQNHVGTFLYLTQIKAVLFTVIPATSSYWLPPFNIAHGIYGQQVN